MIIDLNVTAAEKQKQQDIGKALVTMRALNMIDRSDFINLTTMVNDQLMHIDKVTEEK